MRLAWQIVITYAAVAGLVFVVTYWWLAPWWRSAIGRNLMGMAVALTAVFGLLAVRQFAGPLGLVVWFVSVLVIAVTLTHRTYLLIREHRRAQRTKEMTRV